MLDITVSDEQIQQGEDTLRILEALRAAGITGGDILVHLTKCQGEQILNPRGAERLRRFEEFEIKVGRDVLIATKPVWRALSMVGTLGGKWGREDGSNYESKTVYLLHHCIQQLKQGPVIFQIPDRLYFRRFGEMGWFKRPSEIEPVHWFVVFLTLSCLGIPEDTLKQVEREDCEAIVVSQ